MPKPLKACSFCPGSSKPGSASAGNTARERGKTVDYYNIAAASFGLQIGAQKKDILIAFMTDEALKQFRNSKGWEAGVDGNVALINIGAGGSIDTATIKDPVLAFVFDAKGLMADVSLKGSKFTKLDKSKDK